MDMFCHILGRDYVLQFVSKLPEAVSQTFKEIRQFFLRCFRRWTRLPPVGQCYMPVTRSKVRIDQTFQLSPRLSPVCLLDLLTGLLSQHDTLYTMPHPSWIAVDDLPRGSCLINDPSVHFTHTSKVNPLIESAKARQTLAFSVFLCYSVYRDFCVAHAPWSCPHSSYFFTLFRPSAPRLSVRRPRT